MPCWLALRKKGSEFLRLIGPYSRGEHLVPEFHGLLQLFTEFSFMSRLEACTAPAGFLARICAVSVAVASSF